VKKEADKLIKTRATTIAKFTITNTCTDKTNSNEEESDEVYFKNISRC
jgi:hypothetical protein